MMLVENLVVVFVAGLLTALATGIGAVPFFFVDEFSDRWNVGLWGIASGIMVTVSVFGLVDEGLAYASSGVPTLLIGGLLAGVALVEVADRVLGRVDLGMDAGRRREREPDHEAIGTNDTNTTSSTSSANTTNGANAGRGVNEPPLDIDVTIELASPSRTT